jgi:hypothetical protein
VNSSEKVTKGRRRFVSSSEMLLEQDQERWRGRRNRKRIVEIRFCGRGNTIKTVGEDGEIVESCGSDFVLPLKDKLLELRSSRRTFAIAFAESQNW